MKVEIGDGGGVVVVAVDGGGDSGQTLVQGVKIGWTASRGGVRPGHGLEHQPQPDVLADFGRGQAGDERSLVGESADEAGMNQRGKNLPNDCLADAELPRQMHFRQRISRLKLTREDRAAYGPGDLLSDDSVTPAAPRLRLPEVSLNLHGLSTD